MKSFFAFTLITATIINAVLMVIAEMTKRNNAISGGAIAKTLFAFVDIVTMLARARESRFAFTFIETSFINTLRHEHRMVGELKY